MPLYVVYSYLMNIYCYHRSLCAGFINIICTRRAQEHFQACKGPSYPRLPNCHQLRTCSLNATITLKITLIPVIIKTLDFARGWYGDTIKPA